VAQNLIVYRSLFSWNLPSEFAENILLPGPRALPVFARVQRGRTVVAVQATPNPSFWEGTRIFGIANSGSFGIITMCPCLEAASVSNTGRAASPYSWHVPRGHGVRGGRPALRTAPSSPRAKTGNARSPERERKLSSIESEAFHLSIVDDV
jgi:hypothetical protein